MNLLHKEIKAYFRRTLAMDENWVTVHPNGKEHTGRPVLIEGGVVKAGMGGKFNGRKLSEVKKGFVGAQTPAGNTSKPEHKVESTGESYTEEERNSVEGIVSNTYKRLSLEYVASFMVRKDRGEKVSGDEVRRVSLLRSLDGITDRDVEVYLQMQKEKYKENFHPKKIAGVSRGKDMSLREADGGRVNPTYGEQAGSTTNCQSAVVCYEARIRGYNVETAMNVDGTRCKELSRDTRGAWICEDGTKPEVIVPNKRAYPCTVEGRIEKVKPNTSAGYASFLNETIKEGERYNFSFGWKGHNTAHIVTVYKRDDGAVEIYDPQTNKRRAGDELVAFLDRIVLKKSRGKRRPRIYRIDNAAFNPLFMNDVMRKPNHE